MILATPVDLVRFGARCMPAYTPQGTAVLNANSSASVVCRSEQTQRSVCRASWSKSRGKTMRRMSLSLQVVSSLHRHARSLGLLASQPALVRDGKTPGQPPIESPVPGLVEDGSGSQSSSSLEDPCPRHFTAYCPALIHTLPPVMLLAAVLFVLGRCFLVARTKTLYHIIVASAVDDDPSVDALDFMDVLNPFTTVSFAQIASSDGVVVYSEEALQLETIVHFPDDTVVTTTHTEHYIFSESSGGYIEAMYQDAHTDPDDFVTCTFGGDGTGGCPVLQLGESSNTYTETYSGLVAALVTLAVEQQPTSSFVSAANLNSSLRTSSTSATTRASSSASSATSISPAMSTHPERKSRVGVVAGVCTAAAVLLLACVFWAWRLWYQRRRRAALPRQSTVSDPGRMLEIPEGRVLALHAPTAVERGVVEHQSEALEKLELELSRGRRPPAGPSVAAAVAESSADALRPRRSVHPSTRQEAALNEQVRAMTARIAFLEAEAERRVADDEELPPYAG
ncbi:hypothetical protein HMN09_00209500 [Mycena chlorophos]|uniref:Transmembrane protein n=1 Tax=Mycena chlorophos TaxID=658473 RepID=A0A8H6WJS7_MYCCL|nr:hypothetical protein HMN09_00209500 [Mycena chlorophos]